MYKLSSQSDHLFDIVAGFSTRLNKHDAQLFRFLLSFIKRNLSAQKIWKTLMCCVKQDKLQFLHHIQCGPKKRTVFKNMQLQ